MADPRWHVHGTNPGHLVLYRSVEEGPLAEIACHGDVDPEQVAGVLNTAATVEQTRRERDAAYAVIRRLLDGWDYEANPDRWDRLQEYLGRGLWQPNRTEPMSPAEVDAIRRAQTGTERTSDAPTQ